MSNEGDCRTAPATPGLLIISPCSDGNLPKSMSTRAPWAWHQQGEGVFSKTAALVPYLVLRLPCPVLNSQRGKLATCACRLQRSGAGHSKGPESKGPESKGPESKGPKSKGPESKGPESKGHER